MDLGFLYHVPFLALATRFVGSKRAALGIGRYRKEDLLLVKELVEAGSYRPVIDRTYDLDEIVEATRYVEAGRRRATSCSASATRYTSDRPAGRREGGVPALGPVEPTRPPGCAGR